MNQKTTFIFLRIAVAIILLAHSLPSIITNNVNAFGELFLNKIGFYPYGIILAWLIKISHIISAIFILLNKYLKLVCFSTIFILMMGIISVHYKEGWFVVGLGRNGMEFNFLLIFVLLHIAYFKK